MPNIDTAGILTPNGENRNVNDGDQFVIMNPGEFVDSKFGDKVKTRLKITVQPVDGKEDEQLNWFMNRSTQLALAKEYGCRTDDWVGKSIDVEVKEENINGKVVQVVYGKPVS